MASSLYSFDALMRDFGIVVPLIQRDYAQGRKSAYGVRVGLVEALRRALSLGDALVLDFVYGPLRQGVFLPLDGQQRLTTLFLIHWYLGADMTDWRSFEYKSRRCASRFIAFLRSEDCITYTHSDCCSRELPSSWLCKQSLFVPAWEKDSTVAGMITMLDDICRGFAKCDRNIMVSNLSKIVFYLHECDSSVRADDTYLKINARGEPLTSWENIKSILDARANKLRGRTDAIGNAAKEWRQNINGKWLSAVESLIPERGNAALPHYIALSVSMLNGAFRNVVDLAAMATMSRARALVEKAKIKYGDKFSTMGYADATVGVRDRTGGVKDVRGLEQFFIKEFHDHVATYEDYRNEDIFTDDAFVVMAKIFNALSSKGRNVLKGAWALDRSKNVLWGSDAPSEDFLKMFVFSGVSYSAEVLIDSEREGFDDWVRNEGWIAKTSQSLGFTYHDGIRMLLLSEWDGSVGSEFAISRALNVLDNLNEEVNAAKFVKWAVGLKTLVDDLKKAESADDAKAAFCGMNNSENDSFKVIVSSEIEKLQIYFNEPKESRCFYRTSFGVVEKKLGMMAGSIHFTYDATRKDFDEARATFFLDEFVKEGRVLHNQGFRRLLSYLPADVESMFLPNSISRTNKWFGDWGEVLKQKVVIDSFARMYSCERFGVQKHSQPVWLDCYLRFADGEGWPYRWLARHSMGHGGGMRLFAYNTGSRMSKYCACVQYSEKERKLIDAIRETAGYCIRYGDDYIFFSKKPRYGVKVESIFKCESGSLEIFRKNERGKIEEMPVETIPCSDYSALESRIEAFLSRND